MTRSPAVSTQHWWTRLALGVVLALVSTFPLAAQDSSEPPPFARARLEPGSRITVGQPVTVVVEVLVPTWFTGAPRFPDLDVGDAIAIFEDRGVNFTERIDHQTWAAQSRRYQVYPQRPGAFEIAEIPVRLRYHSDAGGPRSDATVTPPPVRFEATIPPEARDLPYFISTTALDIAQSFDREPDTLKVGEAFARTITVTVRDALSMVVPPITAESLPGLAVYPDPPKVKDEGGERGDPIIGTRVERATYVAEEEGDYTLPAVEIAWWDVKARRIRTASLPPLEIHVDPDPDLVTTIPLPSEDLAEQATNTGPGSRLSLVDLLRRWVVPLATAVLLLLVLFRLWRRFAPILARRLDESRRRRRQSEAAYFAAFRAAARRGDPLATWNRWTAWLDRTHSGRGVATIRAFVHAEQEPDLEAETRALEATLFAANVGERHTWSGKAVYRSVARVRWRRERARSGTARQPLPSLNPVTGERVLIEGRGEPEERGR